MDNPKNQIIARLGEINNILVTVSSNPSVDQLASAIGLTLLLNKMGKHASAVFSGEVPSTLEFLKPESTLEKNTDSLRDFIISLDKSKADKLRYKVEDKVVKIYITPYRTSIDQKDLEFSQGDFNVEAVLALGVQKKEELDEAITAHGRILHDATVITINTSKAGELGSINLVDGNASSLCEIVLGIAEGLKSELDEQIATVLLTGIVAETARFSNEKTSAATMNVSAKLMAAGANQQLVATKLQEKPARPSKPEASFSDKKMDELASEEQPVEPPAELPAPAAAAADGTLSIDHGQKPAKSLDDIMNELDADEAEDELEQIHIDDQGTLMSSKELAQKQESDSSQPPADSDQSSQSDVSTDVDTVPTTGQQGQPTLSHTKTELQPIDDPSAVNDDLPMTASPAPADLPPGVPTEPPAVATVAPPVQTLSDIEAAVDSAHTQQPVELADSHQDVGSARDAVNSAIDNAFRPQPAMPDVMGLPVPAADPLVAPDPPVIAPTQVDDDTLPDVFASPQLPPNLMPADNAVPAMDFPPNLVPPAAPSEETASPSQFAAPPPVPPPMMNPVSPTTPMAGDAVPPAAPQNPLFPQ